MSTPPTPVSERAKINLTKERARNILYKNDPAYRVIRNEVVGTSRWSIHYELIIQCIADGRFWKDGYGVGATESQDESPWEYNEPAFTEVFPVEQVVIVYK